MAPKTGLKKLCGRPGRDVRYSPESGHSPAPSRCLLWDKSCREQMQHASAHPDELDAGAVDERQYIVAEVVFIDLIDLGGGLPDPGLIGTS